MKSAFWLPLALSLLGLPACIHGLNMYSKDGEKLKGRYRFARGDTGLIQVTGSGGEILNGKFVRVGRTTFVESFEKTFGRGSIVTYGPDLSAYGHGFGAIVASSSTITDSARAESFGAASGRSAVKVTGPLFYWTASLRGDRGTAMECFLIGSSHTGSGFGRCKSHGGKEYSVEF